MEKKYKTVAEILEFAWGLSRSQGFWGRIAEGLECLTEEQTAELESYNFQNELEIIRFFEEGVKPENAPKEPEKRYTVSWLVSNSNVLKIHGIATYEEAVKEARKRDEESVWGYTGTGCHVWITECIPGVEGSCKIIMVIQQGRILMEVE